MRAGSIGSHFPLDTPTNRADAVSAWPPGRVMNFTVLIAPSISR